ncbi:hypothetical protein A2U01_0082816, partial [Trifolium medium]|nr:hypothetical protein [Trifolium medium]
MLNDVINPRGRETYAPMEIDDLGHRLFALDQDNKFESELECLVASLFGGMQFKVVPFLLSRGKDRSESPMRTTS